ncbi:glutamate-cysteine ligase family protein [Saccharopolyspora rosea]|uniref:glutamate-cysteine ligase family protein n=1 Tax=Saccharopolyspora rosea TaxID=524884 RepID=UPI0021DA3191|nr:glutamate-cysteine ligase family protein [Saccharopolyspora rosea]
MRRGAADEGARVSATMRRVGLELEFPVVQRSTARGLDRAAAQRLWHRFAALDPTWTVVEEVATGAVTGVRRDAGDFEEHVNSDTGVCTVEVSLAPRETVGAAVSDANAVLRRLGRVLGEMGYVLLCAGIQPRTWSDPARKTQKDWYLLLPRRWHFHHWFVPVASHQASVDVSPVEAARVVNALSGFAGVFTALTASSPVARGRVQPWKEMRNWIWHERCARVPDREGRYTSNGIPPAPYPDIGAYVEHFWDSRLYFLTDLKTRGFEVLGDRSFRDFLLSPRPVPARQVDGTRVRVEPDRSMLDRIHQYGWPAAKLHYRFDDATDLDGVRDALVRRRMAEYFEEHAVHCYVENRSSGVAPQGEEGVGAALTVGLVERLDDAEAVLKSMSWDQWRGLWTQASEHGLAVGDSRWLDIAGDLLELARAGLRGRGAGEEAFLDPLFARLARRETPADRMIAAFRSGGVSRLLDDFGRSDTGWPTGR